MSGERKTAPPPSEDGDEEPKPSLLDTVNASLNANRGSGQDPVLVQDIAKGLGVDLVTFYGWVESDTEFQQGLEKFREVQGKGIFGPDEKFNNRADLTSLAVLIDETKKRTKK